MTCQGTPDVPGGVGRQTVPDLGGSAAGRAPQGGGGGTYPLALVPGQRPRVEQALLAEWALSQPDLPGRHAAASRSAAAKSWQWAGEMEEIAAGMTADDLPGGFHQAAAGIFRSCWRPGS
jgi:Domain of unknown function (DUF1932)